MIEPHDYSVDSTNDCDPYEDSVGDTDNYSPMAYHPW